MHIMTLTHTHTQIKYINPQSKGSATPIYEHETKKIQPTTTTTTKNKTNKDKYTTKKTIKHTSIWW